MRRTQPRLSQLAPRVPAEKGGSVVLSEDTHSEVAPVAPHPTGHDTVVVLDFGSQTSQLIVRRVREAGVYCELLPYDAPAAQAAALHPRAYILSGGPASVYEPGAPGLPAYALEAGVPVLGICFR